MSLNPKLCYWGFWSPKFRWRRIKINQETPTGISRLNLLSSLYQKNLFLCKLPIKNCIKWNQWLKVNCSIIKFVKSQTFFRIEITNDSWKFIISIPDSYHAKFSYGFGPRSVDFGFSLEIFDQVHGQIKSPRKIYAPKLKQNDKVYRWDLVKQFYFGLALIKNQ